MDNTETINILSLCTGYGGIELGLSRALEGVFRVVAVEVEAYALANLAAKAQEGRLAIEAMWPDLKTFPAQRFRGCFDFVLAGFPCQPFSVAGKRGGGADERHLWPHIERIIKTVKPLYVFLENVPGLLSARTLDNRPDLCRYLANLGTLAQFTPTAKKRWYLSKHIYRLTQFLLRTEGIPAYSSVYFGLRDMGYTVEAGLFTAAECGAPHRRERLFILAKSGRAASSNKDGQTCGRTRQEDVPQGNGQACAIRLGAASQLADTKEQRPLQSGRTRRGRARFTDNDKWPSRPGQPQYEWEEPRIVENSEQRRRRRKDESSQRLQSEIEIKRPGKGQAQSRLGGAVDGSSSRVDRLRLLGNGVVLAQAEKAFRYLIRKFNGTEAPDN